LKLRILGEINKAVSLDLLPLFSDLKNKTRGCFETSAELHSVSKDELLRRGRNNCTYL